MDFAFWAYPWNLIDEGPQAVAARLHDIGVGEVSLATNYHAVQTFLPHNPKRRTFFAGASSYFRPDDRYGKLEPVPNGQMGEDWVADIATKLDDRLSLTSWTVGCHNSRLGMQHRDVTIETAHGDDLVFGLCPSNPHVHAYLENIVGDLADRECFNRIELETFDYFYGTGFGWHHQKIHARLGTLGEFLFGLCFCDHCVENARNTGVAAERVRKTVVETFDAIAAGQLSHDTVPERWLAANPEVKAYVDTREEALTNVFESLADAAGSTDLGYYIGMPEAGREWMVGGDLNTLADHVDYYCLPAYESSRSDVLDAYRTVEPLTLDVPVHVGILPGHPAIHDEATVVDIIDGLRAANVPRVSFYNYGLLPDRSLEWVRTAVQS